MIQNETCPECQEQYSSCTNTDECVDILQYMNRIAIHYSGLRTLVRQYYRIRHALIVYIELNQAVANFQVNNIRSLLGEALYNQNHSELKVSNFRNGRQVVEETISFKRLFNSYSVDLQNRLNFQDCASCDKYYLPTGLRTIEKCLINEVSSSIFSSLTAPIKICRNYCYNDIVTKNQIPIYSALNNMKLDEAPIVMKKLNSLELLTIQRAKCFQTVTRLNPYNGAKYFKGTPALRGVSIHLPLNPDETNQYIQETLPNVNALDIIITSLPTKQMKAWRSIINLENIALALEWLKANNKYYADIQFTPTDTFEKYATIHFPVKDDKESNVELEEKSFNQFKNYTVIDLSKCNVNTRDINKYMQKKVLNAPINNNDIHLDHMCFPDIYPKGRGGMYDKRPYPIEPAMYNRWILLNKNSAARRNQQFIFSSIHNKEIRAVETGIFASLNVSKHSNINAKVMLDKLNSNDRELEANLSTTMSAVRNSPDYWCKVTNKLQATNLHFGPATFFGTISSAEYDWIDLKLFLKVMNRDLPNVDDLNFNQLIELDPCSVSLFWDKKFQAFWNKFIANPIGPLGEIYAEFKRREYQARGLPHIHFKLLKKDAPIYGINSDQEVINFIEKHITCRLPDPVLEPRLYALVIKYQRHKCCAACTMRYYKHGRFHKRCRHGFPKPVQSETTLNSVEDVLKSRVNGKRIKKLYNLKRTKEEIYINDCNEEMLLAWQANVDLQFIGENSMALDRYITSYITKAEKNATEKLWEEVNQQKSLKSKLYSFAVKCFKARECGIFEACDKLLGIPMYEFSRQVQFVNTDRKNERMRLLKPKQQLEKLDDDDYNLYHNNMVDTYYPNRSDLYDDMSLFYFVSWYELRTKACIKSHVDCFELKGGYGFMHKRPLEKVIQTRFINCINEKTVEDYFYQILMLFMPWRCEDDLILNCDSYFVAYNHALANDLFDKSSLQSFELRKEKIEAAIKRINQIKEQQSVAHSEVTQSQSEDEATSENKQLSQHIAQENLGIFDLNLNKINVEVLDKNVSDLNKVQRSIYDKIVCIIDHQHQHENKKCQCTSKAKPLRIFCSGVGGTGKSFLIQTITDKLNSVYQNSDQPTSWVVAVLAPTGLAAYNVNGTTIHRFFKLPVLKTRTGTGENFDLSEQDAKAMRELLLHLDLIIIDEISMVSNTRLAQIHLRLEEIFCTGSYSHTTFANKNILVFGDLLQLKPVQGDFLFQNLTRKERRKFFRAHHLDINFWEEFEYFELTENMRQRDDPIFAEMLYRIRLGNANDQDIQVLSQRTITMENDHNKPQSIDDLLNTASDEYLKLSVKENTTHLLCLFSKNETVDKFNQIISDKLMIKTENICAIDDFKRDKLLFKEPTNGSKKRKRAKKITKISETAGLETNLKIGINSRVMLRRNIDVSIGLVNGALGVVTGFHRLFNGNIIKVQVKFDNILQVVNIDRIYSDYEAQKNLYVTRSQFPLTLAWAITVHKCQGLTLDKVLLDLGDDIFEPGMAYVAISRVRKLVAKIILRWPSYYRIQSIKDKIRYKYAND